MRELNQGSEDTPGAVFAAPPMQNTTFDLIQRRSFRSHEPTVSSQNRFLRHLPCEINVFLKRASSISCLTLAEHQFLQDVPCKIAMLGRQVDFAWEVSQMLDPDKSGGFAWSVLKKWPFGPIILGRLGPSWAILGHLGPSYF